MEAKRTAIYCRVELPSDPNPNILALQEESLKMYAKAHGLAVVSSIAEYGSGVDFSRPGLCKVNAAIEEGKIDLLLVKSITRLGRDTEAVSEFLHWIKERGVDLVCADGIRPEPYMEMMGTIHSSFDTYPGAGRDMR